MDASNPVITGERTTFGDLQQENLLLKRQNLQLLKSELSTEERTPPPFIDRLELSVDKDVVKRLCEPLPVAKGSVDLSFAVSVGTVPVSPWHPQGVNQSGGSVSLVPVFRVSKRDSVVVTALMREVQDPEEHISRLVYSTGSKTGLSERIKLWYSNRVPNPKMILQPTYNVVPMDVLAHKLPYDESTLTDWNSELGPQLSRVTVNKKSSTGPPFYRPKFEALDESMALLEEILTKSSFPESLGQFLADNPELLLAQCKNKTDRYEVAKLAVKTRPYYSFSFPIQILFSRLSQEFTEALYLFTQHRSSANGYGFSWADGGGDKMRLWMLSTQEGETKYCVYGDDVRLVRRKNDVLYSCSPDFKCMDGSVHKVHAAWAVDYIIAAYKKKFGGSEFWEYIGELWKRQLVGAKFIVSGVDAYANLDSGLLTGCVGTTYVDTVTAILAYETFVEASRMGQIDVTDEKQATTFFSKLGLRLKQGTYEWELVDEENKEGMFLEQEWLGCSLHFEQGRREVEPIPFKKREDLVSLMGNVRHDPDPKSSAVVAKRYYFDMARGYMITGAFHHQEIWNTCCDLIDKTEDLVIAMRVQTGKKVQGERVGEGPELLTMVGEDFAWPTSDGFPNQSFCKNVFLSKDNRLKDGEWIPAFPKLADKIKEARKVLEYVSPVVPRTRAWAFQDSGDPEEMVEGKRNPQKPSKIFEKTPMLALKMKLPSKLPGALLKFKKSENPLSKKDRLLALIPPDADQVHREYLPLSTGYSRDMIAKVLAEEGWFPGQNAYWTREKGEKPSPEWTFAELNPEKLGQLTAPPPNPQPSPSECSYPRFQIPDEILPPSDKITEPISYVSAAFSNAFEVLEWRSVVESQTPSVVSISAHLRSDPSYEVAYACATRKSTAKELVCSLMKKAIESRKPPPKTSNPTANNDEQSREERSPTPTPNPEETGGTCSADDATTASTADSEPPKEEEGASDAGR